VTTNDSSIVRRNALRRSIQSFVEGIESERHLDRIDDVVMDCVMTERRERSETIAADIAEALRVDPIVRCLRELRDAAVIHYPRGER
jgi:hypothetical protein